MKWPLETRIDEMMRDPEALRLAYARLYAQEGPVSVTPRQKDALNVIREHWAKHGVSPTLDEIGAAMWIGKSNVHALLDGLEQRGAIVRHHRLKRSIVIVNGRS